MNKEEAEQTLEEANSSKIGYHYNKLKAEGFLEGFKKGKASNQKDVLKLIEDWEKENNQVLKTEDIIKGKIIIADYVKGDKIKELKKRIEQKSVKSNKDNKITRLDHEWLGTSV